MTTPQAPVPAPVGDREALVALHKRFLSWAIGDGLPVDRTTSPGVVSYHNPVTRAAWRAVQAAAVPSPAVREPAASLAAVPAENMTARRAQFFLERFQREEKLLGPNERAGVAYAIAALEREQHSTAPQLLPAPPAVPAGMVMVPDDLITDAIGSICDYIEGIAYGSPDHNTLTRLRATLAAPQAAQASPQPVQPADEAINRRLGEKS